jgi:hypothetical protein
MAGPMNAPDDRAMTATWCDRCGAALPGEDHATGQDHAPGADHSGDHAPCAAARALEPPRFCPRCGRRMRVQVLPAGWRAVCVEHGDTRSD